MRRRARGRLVLSLVNLGDELDRFRCACAQAYVCPGVVVVIVACVCVCVCVLGVVDMYLCERVRVSDGASVMAPGSTFHPYCLMWDTGLGTRVRRRAVVAAADNGRAKTSLLWTRKARLVSITATSCGAPKTAR